MWRYSNTRSRSLPLPLSLCWRIIIASTGIGISCGSGGEGRGCNRSRDVYPVPTNSLSPAVKEPEAILVVGQANLAVQAMVSLGFRATQESPLAMVLLLRVLYLLQPPKIS